ncbi:hypothetical protein FJR38_15860 [Anabaena sp. UHCC 0253]|uniref:DUF7925 domain-containing protein n=1 Tax=Anabaena sp. UHCC 0253 TaxID=2590019 RepID=UPI00144704FF|nr:hypothetical protein [Anabaena sp. UHCC 0253]MTJ54016.1 hypothetical protein [Anabaena sp. UHCC 0253]
MHSTKKTLKQRQFRVLRALVATAFITNGIFPFITPALADGTAAGTSISNTATAEYEDPNVPGTKIPATSNTVTVTVAEVTGINAVADGVSDNTAGTIQIGDVLTYNFKVTNIGNDPTTFNIPTTVTLAESVAGAGTVGTIEYSIDGGQNWISSATTPVTSTIPIYNPAQNIPSTTVPVGTILIRVPVTINPAATPGTTINVQLGNTPDPDTQNQPSNVTTATEELSTKDLPDSDTNDVDGPPLGGEKEASANQTATVGAKDYALATLLKTRSNHNNNSTPSNVTDDTVTYGLSLNVATTAPAGTNITPVALQGINDINIDGNANPATPYILISDAIPKDTELNAAPTPPNANWEAVYTIEPADQNVSGYKDANKALWKRFGAGGTLKDSDALSQVTRIGFINKATLTSVAPGTSVTGFSVTVKVKLTATAPLSIANIAQLFGGTNTPNTPGTLPVYEESGDNNPSNYEPGTGFPGTDSNSDGVPDTIDETAVDDGYIDNPATPETGTETTNNGNDGAGPLGEANQFTIDTAALFNGPSGQPAAVGPTSNNDDFTNKSSAVPANTAPGSTIDPASVAFTNTVRNDGSAASNITLLPTPPATAGALPTGTIVVISDPANPTTTATYTYNGTAFTTSDAPIVINVPAGVTNTANYTVAVDLPAGTQLSTDIERGYPVPITAFIDSGTVGLDANDIQNTTINRVYTGFLKLVKFSRILDASGNALPAPRSGQSDFATTPNVDADISNDVPRNPQPGEIIEYQIRYKNIASETNTAPATNNVILNVSGLTITEDGTGTNGNWALDQDANGIIDTSNVANSAVDSVPASATITYFSGSPATSSAGAATTGTTQATDVTKYENSITVQIAPGVERTFTFRRKVN